MNAKIIVGAQWGDEGKGKITDYLAENVDIVARFQGGNNAGHTLIVDGETYKLHLIPSGILYPDKLCVLGNGVVINPEVMLAEIKGLEDRGISCKNLLISPNAHVIMPYHIALDVAEEESRSKEQSIGTTRRGIGPCYSDKTARFGVRVQDLLDKNRLKERIEIAMKPKMHLLTNHLDNLKVDEIVENYYQLGKELEKYIADVADILYESLAEGKVVLAEGAQGALLDIDHGMYPFVTSSNCLAPAASVGAGIPPQAIKEVWGVAKAYPTRVDTVGPFPSKLEESGEINTLLVDRGKEFGTTTGRRRRCGWLDLVALKQAVKLNGMTHLALTKLDVMYGINPLKVAVAYKTPDGQVIDKYPYDMNLLASVEPVYHELKGFEGNLENVRKFEDLPNEVVDFIRFIEDYINIPVGLVGVGQSRDQIIEVKK